MNDFERTIIIREEIEKHKEAIRIKEQKLRDIQTAVRPKAKYGNIKVEVFKNEGPSIYLNVPEGQANVGSNADGL